MENEKGLITLENRKVLKLTGVREVLSFQENAAELFTSLGNLQITGEKMHMEKLDLETGEVILTGRIDSLYYPDRESGEKKGLFSRFFS